MILEHKETKQRALVYGYYMNDNGKKVYITHVDKHDPVQLEHEININIIDNTPSRYWEDNAKEGLPLSWTEENFLYELVDNHNPLGDNTFKKIKELIDKEFSYCNLETIPETEEPLHTANAIGYNWILCPECDEAFEVNISQNIVTCPNIACELRIHNPYVKWCPLPPSQSITP